MNVQKSIHFYRNTLINTYVHIDMCIHVPIHVDLDANKNDDEDGALNFNNFVVSSCFVSRRLSGQTPIGCLISQLETDHPNGAIL